MKDVQDLFASWQVSKPNKVVSSNILFRMQRQFQAVEVHTFGRSNTLRACLRTKRDISCCFQTGGVWMWRRRSQVETKRTFRGYCTCQKTRGARFQPIDKKNGTEGGKQYLLIYDVCYVCHFQFQLTFCNCLAIVELLPCQLWLIPRLLNTMADRTLCRIYKAVTLCQLRCLSFWSNSMSWIWTKSKFNG